MTQRNKQNALMLADLHLLERPLWRFEWLEKFLAQLQAGDYEGAPLPLFLMGDVFEVRDKVDSRVVNMLVEFIRDWKEDVVWVCGQHDSHRPGRGTLEGLHNSTFGNKKVYVVDRDVFYHEATDTWHVPFCREEVNYRTLLDKVPTDALVITHLPLKEAIEEFGAKDVHNVSVKEFNRFDWTYSGDIHKYVDYNDDKFSYVGGVVQRDWRDKGMEGQFGILKNGRMTRYATDGPLHVVYDGKTKLDPSRQYIVKSLPNVNIEGEANIIERVGAVSVDLDSVELTDTSKTSDALISDYVKDNKGEVSGATSEMLIDKGTSIFKESAGEV